MILECPQCHSRYLVPDSAIGAAGRTVRCASCRHSWFQDGTPTLPPIPSPIPAQTERVVRPVSVDPVDDVPPAIAPLPQAGGESYDAFAHRPPFTPRRNPARRWTAAAVAAGLLMLVGVGLILWSSAPGLLQSIGLPIGPEESPLRLIDNPIERRPMTNGSELFAVSGRILNPSTVRQRVPDIRADLRDVSGRIVFSWTITPQQRTLGPKSAIEFNSAKLDVPATSKQLELSFAGEAGS